MSTIWTRLQDRRRAAPGAPVVTYIAADGARVELSATTLENGAAKIANALGDEFDVETGSRVALLLPVHWQRATWLAGCWVAGCQVLLPRRPTEAAGADLLVTTAGEVATGEATTPAVVVSLHPLGLPVPDAAARGVVDATVAVRSAPDAFLGIAPAASATALALDDEVLDQRRLLEVATERAGAWGLAPGGRLLVGPGADALDGWLAALAVPLAMGASVVLVAGDHNLDRIAGQEHVTATLGR